MAPQNVRVLIVGEDADLARHLSTYLARRHFDVTSANGGEEAARLLHLHDPALVLLDLPHSGTHGIDTLKRIRQIRPDVRVILLAVGGDPEFIFQVSKLGADDYIRKPFESRELGARIAKVMERRRRDLPDDVENLLHYRRLANDVFKTELRIKLLVQ